MSPCDEVKKRKSEPYYRFAPDISETHWCSGCNIGYRNVLHKVGFKELKPSLLRVAAI